MVVLAGALPGLRVASGILGWVRTRLLIGVGAWLLGVAMATTGSLLAVSRLSQGIADTPSQQLNAAMVNRVLASELAHDRAASNSPTIAPSGTTAPAALRLARHRHSGAPTASPSPQLPSGTVLTSVGGSVVASCGTSGAFLQSWSPQQGYEVGNVVRGPATTAQVQFETLQQEVTMVVSCTGGVPTASNTVQPNGRGDE